MSCTETPLLRGIIQESSCPFRSSCGGWLDGRHDRGEPGVAVARVPRAVGPRASAAHRHGSGPCATARRAVPARQPCGRSLQAKSRRPAGPTHGLTNGAPSEMAIFLDRTVVSYKDEQP